MHGAQQHLWMDLHFPQKMHMHLCMRAYTIVQKLLCHESYCELVTWRCSLKKSVQIHANSWLGRHCGVSQASSDHPRWCRSHPVCLSVTLSLVHGVYPSQKSVFTIFRASFFYIWTCGQTTHITLKFANCPGCMATTLWCLRTRGHCVIYTDDTYKIFVPFPSQYWSTFSIFTGLLPAVRGAPPKSVPPTTGGDKVWLLKTVEWSGVIVGDTYTTGLQGTKMYMCVCVNVHMYTYTCICIHISIYMYVHVYICMWCGDAYNAVYTVLPSKIWDHVKLT
jgi:hypothetical protein